MGQGAAACATSDAHIGNPPPAAATANAAAAATVRRAEEGRCEVIVHSMYTRGTRIGSPSQELRVERHDHR